MKNRAAIISIAVLLIIITGCGVPFQRKLDMYLQAEQYKEADALIEAEKTKPKENIYNDKNTLLYLFDKGAVRQMMGDYEYSTAYLEKADEKIDALYTRSVVNEVGSFLSNDLALDYTGEDFEQVMVDTLKALNFMYSGDYNEARVEARKIDHRLNLFSDKYGPDAIYIDDAFARYLSGFCYEALGEINNAYIDYRKSLDAYERYRKVYDVPVPPFIKQDIIRTADALKFNDEIAEMQGEWGEKPDFTPVRELKAMGEVLVVVYDGLPAYKYDDNHWPKFRDRGTAISDVKIKAGNKEFQGYVAENISRMAQINLGLKNAQILAKKIGSTVAKSLAKNVPILNMFVSEDKADTRSWRTIPARFHIVRAVVEPGKHNLTIELYPSSGADVREEKITVNVKAGGKKVVPIYVFSGEKLPPVAEK
jgi:hypothetical protein